MTKKMKLSISICISSIAVLASCAGAPSDDPLEPANRVVHEFNKSIDAVILNPISEAYDLVTDEDVQQKVANASANLSEPKSAVNHLLQGELEAAAINSSRFIYNSTFGIAGMYDQASGLGLFPAPTNFNQTLAKWGVPSGPYIELPILGPNTFRSTAGFVVDTQLNPVPYALSEEQKVTYNSFIIAARVNDRARYGNLVEMLLYQSPDSYLATRLAYLQNQKSQEERVSGDDQAETVELENFYE